METFLECETMSREPPPGHVFVGSLAEIDRRKVAEVVRRWPNKKRLCDPFFGALSEAHSAISLETSFQASTPPAKFHPNPSKFPRFISENDVPDRYNNRRSDINMQIFDAVMTKTWRLTCMFFFISCIRIIIILLQQVSIKDTPMAKNCVSVQHSS